MYWLFSEEKQKEIRELIDNLVMSLSEVNHKPPHQDQVFPFQGRKAINHAKTVIDALTSEGDIICDPFVGSGSFAYAGAMCDRNVLANEFEVYTNRMAFAPFSLPDKQELINSFNEFVSHIRPYIDNLYRTRCVCGQILPLDSLFFDRSPLRYTGVASHERLGDNGENITFRGKFKCKSCGAIEKHFDDYDQEVLDTIEAVEEDFFEFRLIENSRINLSSDFLDYKKLFPKRSRLVLTYLWKELELFAIDPLCKKFIEDALLSVIPLAKYKDYRSKSQDLHCPPQMLRESNILNALIKQVNKRAKTLYGYDLNNYQNAELHCDDFRRFLSSIQPEGVDLVVTDPPWNDGNAYFERAQLYHPWLGYDLKADDDRLSNEVIVTDSPERPDKREKEQWWSDVEDLFEKSYVVLKEHAFLVLYFRPVPANEWIVNFNRLKLLARMNGFEPLLTCDLTNKDPSMRIQQSAHYAFSSDLILTFIKLSDSERRVYCEGHDVDEISFRVAVELQDELFDAFTLTQWLKAMYEKVKSLGLMQLNLPKNRHLLHDSFLRVCEDRGTGKYLPKAITPYSDEIFNTPYIERVSLYVPYVIEELLFKSDKFTFDQFLLKIAEFVENGTRAILKDILEDSENSIHSLLNLYAEPIEGGLYFTKRPLPQIPSNIANLLELAPYEFEVFTAKLLELEGFTNVVVSGQAGDRGVDVRCNDGNGDLVIVQCKRYTKSNIGSTPIQRLHSFAVTRGASRKICITTTDFTRDGYDEAKKADVELINREALENLVHKHNLFN
ncbi:restriction endonuclease [Shewanella fidelis]|uniref:restriction endonuclease n=1 Tax=Shewanella fidelis TaxID=173509 RepID=UPI0004AC9FA0|nr:restriction endonuclease [Shewanella fidelis]